MNPFILTSLVAAFAGLVAWFLTLRSRRLSRRERTYNMMRQRKPLSDLSPNERMAEVRRLRNPETIRRQRNNVGNYKQALARKVPDEPVPSKVTERYDAYHDFSYPVAVPFDDTPHHSHDNSPSFNDTPSHSHDNSSPDYSSGGGMDSGSSDSGGSFDGGGSSGDW